MSQSPRSGHPPPILLSRTLTVEFRLSPQPRGKRRCSFKILRGGRPGLPRRGCQGPARSGAQPSRAGAGFPLPRPPLQPPPGRVGLGSSEPSGGLGTGRRSSVPPRCVAGCGFIILIDSSCSPTPWGPRPRKGEGSGICGAHSRPSTQPLLGLPG